MMTKSSKRLMLAALAMAFAAAPAYAQMRPFQIGLGGGPSIATGDFADEAETGYNVQASLGLSIPLIPIGARADLLWQESPDAEDGTFRQIGGMLNGILGLSLIVAKPYVLAGVGMIHHSAPDEAHIGHTHEGEDGTSTAFNVGAGLELGLLGLAGFGEVRYLDAGEGRTSIPVTVGIRF
jgi:opacity protein-like surface antigen